MQIWIIIFLVLSVVCGASMGIAWFFKLRSFLLLLLASAAGGGAIGGFLSMVGSAMATSVHPRDALIKGVAIGIALGLIWGGACLGIMKAMGKLGH